MQLLKQDEVRHMLIDKEEVRKEFQAYVEGYNHKEEKINLKIKHTYRVAALCSRIALALNQKEEEIELAWLIGMLHDIGRFKQIKNYGTFVDAKSINHAHYGVEILFEQGLIRRFIKTNQFDEIIKNAIAHHNAYKIPEHLDEYTILFCNIIRDADKIDILKVNVETPIQTVYEFSEEEIKQSAVTKEVMECYYNHQAIRHSLKKTPLDHLVGHISLAFELVFPISYAIVKEQGYLNQLLSFQPEKELSRHQFENIKKEMISFINIKTTN